MLTTQRWGRAHNERRFKVLRQWDPLVGTPKEKDARKRLMEHQRSAAKPRKRVA